MFITTAAIFVIGLLWINFNEKVFKTVRHFISAPFSEEEVLCDEEESPYDEVIDTMATSDNKLMKTIKGAATLTGLAAGISWISQSLLQPSGLATGAASLSSRN